jgi:hypothetical protein
MQRSDTALLHPQIAAKLEIPGSQRWRRFIASIGLENDGLQKPFLHPRRQDSLVLRNEVDQAAEV